MKNDSGKSGKTSESADPFDEKAEAIRLKEVSSDLVVGEGQTKDGLVDATEAIAELEAEEEAVEEANSEAVAAT